MNESRRRASFAFMYLSISKPCTSPAICDANGAASKREMRVIPGLAATMLDHASSSVLPTGLTMPSPVTTTRRRVKSGTSKLNVRGSRLLAVGHDEIDRLLHGGDLLRFFVGNLGLEFLFQRHHELHGVERIGAEVIDERRFVLDLRLVHAELLGNNLLHALFDVFHASSYECAGTASPVMPPVCLLCSL